MIALYVDHIPNEVWEGEVLNYITCFHVDDRLGSARDRLEATILEYAERNLKNDASGQVLWEEGNLHIVPKDNGGEVHLFDRAIGYYQLRGIG